MNAQSKGSPEPPRPARRVADPWGGVWRGTAELRRPDGSALEFDVELELPELREDPSEPARAALVYCTGDWVSNRTIRLEETPFPDVRSSEVEVNGCRQSAQSTREGDSLQVVIVATRPIAGRSSVVAVQRARLRRERSRRT